MAFQTTIGELRYDLVVDTSEFDRRIARSRRQIQRLENDLRNVDSRRIGGRGGRFGGGTGSGVTGGGSGAGGSTGGGGGGDSDLAELGILAATGAPALGERGRSRRNILRQIRDDQRAQLSRLSGQARIDVQRQLDRTELALLRESTLAGRGISELRDIGRLARREFRALPRSVGTQNLFAGGIVGGAAAAGLAGGAFVQSSIQATRQREQQLRPLIERANVEGRDIERLQELIQVSARLGSEDPYEGVVDSLQELRLQLGELALTGEGRAKTALEELGLEFDDLAAKSPVEAMLEIIQTLQNVEDQTLKTFAAEEIFGGAFERNIGVINASNKELQEALRIVRETGNVLDEETIESVKAFNLEWERSLGIFGSIQTGTTNRVLPSLTNVLRLANDTAIAIGDLNERYMLLDRTISAGGSAVRALLGLGNIPIDLSRSAYNYLSGNDAFNFGQNYPYSGATQSFIGPIDRRTAVQAGTQPFIGPIDRRNMPTNIGRTSVHIQEISVNLGGAAAGAISSDTDIDLLGQSIGRGIGSEILEAQRGGAIQGSE